MVAMFTSLYKRASELMSLTLTRHLTNLFLPFPYLHCPLTVFYCMLLWSRVYISRLTILTTALPLRSFFCAHVHCHITLFILSAIWPTHVRPQPQCSREHRCHLDHGTHCRWKRFLLTLTCTVRYLSGYPHAKAGDPVCWTGVQTLSDYLEHNLNCLSLSKCSVQCTCSTWK